MNDFDNPLVIPRSGHSSVVISGSDTLSPSDLLVVASFIWDVLLGVQYIPQRKSCPSSPSSSTFASDGWVSLGVTVVAKRGDVVLSASSSF